MRELQIKCLKIKLITLECQNNFSFNNHSGFNSREGSRRNISIKNIEKPFDLQNFFNDLKWHNSVKANKGIIMSKDFFSNIYLHLA